MNEARYLDCRASAAEEFLLNINVTINFTVAPVSAITFFVVAIAVAGE